MSSLKTIILNLRPRLRVPISSSCVHRDNNEPIRTQFRSDSLQILNLRIFFLCINCLCNKICFCSLCCPLSVQNYHKLKRIHANIVQNPTFLERFQSFGGQCISKLSFIPLYILRVCSYFIHTDLYNISLLKTC